MSLLAGARFPRWYWLTFNAARLFGVGFCTWLQFQSLYRINALCLWCSLAWVAHDHMFWYVTSFNVRNGCCPPPLAAELLRRVHLGLPVLHIGIIGMLDPDPLVGLLDRLRAGSGAGDQPGGVVRGVT